MNFESAFTKLLGHEGQYSDHPADRGGETCWGVTVAVARAHGYEGPMKELPVTTAQTIYRREYWDKCRAESVPEQVRYPLFDAAVNSGVGQSVKWLQRAVGVQDDGVIGPKTIVATKNMPGDIIASRMLGHRLQFMSSLPNWPAFGRGWSNRVAKILIGD